MTSEAVWMERIRSRSSHFKSFGELSKFGRTALLERRYGLDSEEKSALRTCIDHLSEAIPVRDAVSMAERLEAIARKTTSESGGLNFNADPVHGCFYLSTEMFYIEINIDSAGIVTEAKVHHIDPSKETHKPPITINCPEMRDCLSSGNFSKFVQHLDGLISLYNLPVTDATQKFHAWTALTAMEQDLKTIFNTYSNWHIDAYQMIHQTPLGLVEPRVGGIPMKLRYFMPPHELLDEATGKLLPCTIPNVSNHDLGLWMTIGIEKSVRNRPMQLTTLVCTNPQGQPIDLPLSSKNSETLPAQFVMRLNRPVPVLLSKCREISRITEMNFFDEASALPLIQLIVKTASDDKLDSGNNRGLFVNLPGQQHCYFLTDHPNLTGVLVSSIPFSVASNVPDILAILRQQAVFNTIVSSCVRTSSVQDLDKALKFELSSLDLEHVTITFQMPNEESMATVELDLSNISAFRCSVFSANVSDSVCPEELASKIIQKSLSVPITMRALICHGQCKSEPEPEVDTEMTSIFNGNIKDPNQNFNTMDFALSVSGRNNDLSMKTNPMDFDGFNNHYSHESLNTFGPQVATFHPEASSSDNRHHLGTCQQPSKSNDDSNDNSKTAASKSMTLSEVSSAGVAVSNVKSSSNLSIKLQPSAVNRFKTAATPPKTKSSVSILPGGIEIIPLDVSPDSSSKSSYKDIRRSLSEDDKRKFDRKDGSATKKRKHDYDRNSFGHKKSPNSKRPLFDGQDASRKSFQGHSDHGKGRNDSAQSLMPEIKTFTIKREGSDLSKKSSFQGHSDHIKNRNSNDEASKNPQSYMPDTKREGLQLKPELKRENWSTSANTKSFSKIKFSTGIDGATNSTSVIEITSTSSLNSSDQKSGLSITSCTSSSSKDRKGSESPSLKLTIKNSGGGSKHKSDHYHKSSSGKSGSTSKLTSSSSSSSSKPRSSSSLQQKYPTYKSSSSSPSSSSSKQSSSQKSSASRHDKDREREKEEAKRLLAGGKLNSTFQIPKLSKSDETSPSLPSLGSTSIKPVGTYGQTSGIRAPSTSPKFPPSTPSPKYPQSVSGSAVVSPKMSPKTSFIHATMASAAGAIVSPKPPTPPNISPHSGSKKTPSSSPTHGGNQGLTNSSSMKPPPSVTSSTRPPSEGMMN